MTHIEAKAANLSLGGPGETLGEAEGSLSPEAFALFSKLFLQMQPEMDAATETTGQSTTPEFTPSVTDATMLPSTTVSQKAVVSAKVDDYGAVDAGASDLSEIANLTELLIAAQQVVGNNGNQADAANAAVDKTIFSDAPMVETKAFATKLMQQAATALIERKHLIKGTEGFVSRNVYDSEALSNPQLTALIEAAIKPALEEFGEWVSNTHDGLADAPKVSTETDLQIAIGAAPNITIANAAPNALQGPVSNSGRGQVPVHLANLVQGPPQSSGQGPVVPPLAKQLQGPPQSSGQGPVVPPLAKQLQAPPQSSGQESMVPELAKQLQGPPQASGQKPAMTEVAEQFQGSSNASGWEPLSTKRPMAGADCQVAPSIMTRPMISQGDTTDDGLMLSELLVAKDPKAEFLGKTNIKNEIKSGQTMPEELRIDRVMKPADAALHKTSHGGSETIPKAQLGGAPSRTMTAPMVLDLSRQMANETVSDSNKQTQQSAASTASAAQQQGGQSGGNASGQPGRDAHQGIDPGAKNAGGERVAVYRLNVQQNGWADIMVRRLSSSFQNGSGAVRIILEPRNLGRLQVNMGLRDGRAAIRIAADTMQAASLLHDSRAQLAQMFEQAGFRLTNMQTTNAIINGDGGATADGGGSQMFADHQTSGHNANKDGKNSEHSNKLLADGVNESDIEIDTTTALAPGETAVLNVLA